MSPSEDVEAPKVITTDEASAFESLSKAETHDDVEEFCPDARFFVVLTSLFLMIFIVAVNDGILGVALPSISRSLHANGLESFWAGTSCLLSSTVFQPIYIHLSHRFGRKALVVLALIIFLGGTTCGAAAQGPITLIVARAFMGIGGGGLLVLPEVILPDIVPLRARGTWMGVVNAAYGGGCLVGPVLGGLFAEKTSWRWAMLFNIPLVVATLSLVGPFMHLPLSKEITKEPLLSRLRRNDWGGIAIFMPSIALFILPITWTGVIFPFLSLATIETLILALTGLTGFAVYEKFFAIEPLLPTSIFRKRTVIITYFNIFAVGAVLYAEVYFIPLFAQATRRCGPILAGVLTLPFAGVYDLVAVLIGISITRSGKYRWSNVLGFAFQALGLGLLSFLGRDVDAPPVKWVMPMVLAGIGSGFLCASLRITIQSAVSSDKTADAMSFYSFIRNVGLTIGVALSGTIFQDQIRRSLSDVSMLKDQADKYSKDVVALIPVIPEIADQAAQRAIRQSYADAFSTINIVLCCLSGIGLLLSFFVKSYDMNRCDKYAGPKKCPSISSRGSMESNFNTPLLMRNKELRREPSKFRDSTEQLLYPASTAMSTSSGRNCACHSLAPLNKTPRHEAYAGNQRSLTTSQTGSRGDEYQMCSGARLSSRLDSSQHGRSPSHSIIAFLTARPEILADEWI